MWAAVSATNQSYNYKYLAIKDVAGFDGWIVGFFSIVMWPLDRHTAGGMILQISLSLSNHSDYIKDIQ